MNHSSTTRLTFLTNPYNNTHPKIVLDNVFNPENSQKGKNSIAKEASI